MTLKAVVVIPVVASKRALSGLWIAPVRRYRAARRRTARKTPSVVVARTSAGRMLSGFWTLPTNKIPAKTMALPMMSSVGESAPCLNRSINPEQTDKVPIDKRAADTAHAVAAVQDAHWRMVVLAATGISVPVGSGEQGGDPVDRLRLG